MPRGQKIDVINITFDIARQWVQWDGLCKNLSKKLIKHPAHRKMFTFKEGRDTRAGRKVIVPHTTTRRYENSSVPSLAKLINDIKQ